MAAALVTKMACRYSKVTMCCSVRLLTVLPSSKSRCYCANLERIHNMKYENSQYEKKKKQVYLL